jgi:hypothetical protein
MGPHLFAGLRLIRPGGDGISLSDVEQTSDRLLSFTNNPALVEPSLKGPDIVGLSRIVPIHQRDIEATFLERGGNAAVLIRRDPPRFVSGLR